MGVKILTRDEKLAEIRRGKAVIERFERAVGKWLKKELETKKVK